tara:strand:+ start:5993 stop:6277 length:285 start_codon:yes stop_codon:yes gene_type:complete
MKKVHEVKTVEPHFSDIVNGKKRAELRLNDRDYQEGDTMVLKQYWPAEEPSGLGVSFGKDEAYGEEYAVTITSVTKFPPALRDNWVMLSITPMF